MKTILIYLTLMAVTILGDFPSVAQSWDSTKTNAIFKHAEKYGKTEDGITALVFPGEITVLTLGNELIMIQTKEYRMIQLWVNEPKVFKANMVDAGYFFMLSQTQKTQSTQTLDSLINLLAAMAVKPLPSAHPRK